MADKKIFLIEDEDTLAEMYRMELERKGFEMTRTIDGETGIKKIKEEKPDLILLDLLLPKMNGREVLKELKKDPETKDIKVIILTNYDTPEERQITKEIGAERYVLKTGVTPSELAQIVEEEVEKEG